MCIFRIIIQSILWRTVISFRRIILAIAELSTDLSTDPDIDATTVGNAEPISVGREAKCVDAAGFLLVVEGVQVFALVQVPEHGETVLKKRDL